MVVGSKYSVNKRHKGEAAIFRVLYLFFFWGGLWHHCYVREKGSGVVVTTPGVFTFYQKGSVYPSCRSAAFSSGSNLANKFS